MDYDIPYYVLDNDGNIKSSTEPYIDDDDLKELLISLLGDDVSSDEIQKNPWCQWRWGTFWRRLR